MTVSTKTDEEFHLKKSLYNDSPTKTSHDVKLQKCLYRLCYQVKFTKYFISYIPNNKSVSWQQLTQLHPASVFNCNLLKN